MIGWASVLRRCAWLSALFCAITLGALGWNAFASRASDPNPPTRVDDLVTRINLNPGDKQLLSDLRRQDYWLRTSYFRSVKFAQNGFFLLFGGVALFLLCAKGADKLRSKPPKPDPNAPARTATDALIAQSSVLALGGSLACVLAAVATFSRHDSVASYVRGTPLPQVTPVAPEAARALPPAVASPGAALPVLNGPIPASSPIAGPVIVPSGPVALGGTSLAPLPIATNSKTPVSDNKVGVTGATGKAEIGGADGWGSFRGPRMGVVASWNPPPNWDVPSGKGVLWKADLSLPGWNSPVIEGGRVFVAGADEKRREIGAFDFASGKPLWRLGIPVLAGTKPVKPSPDAGYAPSTMATDGKHVFAAFVDGNVVCVSTDGKPLWGRQFGPLENSYGFASSLLVIGGNLIVQVDQGSSADEGKSLLYALEPSTGKTVWSTKRPVSASWSSPAAILVGGKPAIVVIADPGVAAYDASTGDMLWTATGLSGEIAASPAFGDGRLFVGQQGSILMAIDATDGKVLWKTSDPALPDIASPAYGGGLVFLTTSDGTTSAIDGANGKIVWEKRLEKPCRASPVVVGDSLYLLGIDGVLRVIKASRSYTVVGQNRIGEPCEATPAFAEGRMVVRAEHHLFCIGVK